MQLKQIESLFGSCLCIGFWAGFVAKAKAKAGVGLNVNEPKADDVKRKAPACNPIKLPACCCESLQVTKLDSAKSDSDMELVSALAFSFLLTFQFSVFILASR